MGSDMMAETKDTVLVKERWGEMMDKMVNQVIGGHPSNGSYLTVKDCKTTQSSFSSHQPSPTPFSFSTSSKSSFPFNQSSQSPYSSSSFSNGKSSTQDKTF